MIVTRGLLSGLVATSLLLGSSDGRAAGGVVGVTVASARLGSDGQTVHLDIPAIAPTWGMEIRYDLKSAAGKSVQGNIHNTVHKLKN